MRCHFVAKNIFLCLLVKTSYDNFLARPDLIGKLRSEATWQVKIAWSVPLQARLGQAVPGMCRYDMTGKHRY